MRTPLFQFGYSGRGISKPKQFAASTIAAGRIQNPRAGRQKSLKRTQRYFDVPPFQMCDRLFRIEKIAAFAGGVKSKVSKSKRGGWGAGSLEGSGIEFRSAP